MTTHLSWLIKLRWGAVLTQALLVLVVGLALHNLAMALLWQAGVRNTALDVAAAWKEIVLADPTGADSISNVQLTPDGKGYCYSFVRTLSRLYVVENLR